MTSIQNGHSHRVMRDYAIKLHNNSVGKKISICIIFSRTIIYHTFILQSVLKIKTIPFK